MNKPKVILNESTFTVGHIVRAMADGCDLSGIPIDAMNCTLDKAKSVAEVLAERLTGNDASVLLEENLAYVIVDLLGMMEVLLDVACTEVDRLEKMQGGAK